MKLTLAWLYGAAMNIYGDRGNILSVVQRCRWRGIDVEVVEIGVDEPIEAGRYDLFFWGGGQDREQISAASDIQGPKGDVLKAEVEDGAPLLAVCGGYQLLGKYYRPHEGADLPGIGLFDAWTDAGERRMIGNIVVQTSQFGELVGFENHSGLTRLGAGAEALGKVRVGFGNNGEDGTEGCRYRNAIGCYMHGALLPKNPRLTDFLIGAALERRYGPTELQLLDDRLESTAHASAVERALVTR